MSVEVRVPSLPESVADATLVNWKKKPGEAVKRDENLVDLETDKVVLEVPAPVDGVMGEIVQADGSTVKSGDLIAYVLAGEASSAAPTVTAPVSAPPPPSPQIAAVVPPTEADLEDLSPAVRRLVAEQNIDLSKIVGTGRGGRVTKTDAERLLEAQRTAAILTTFNEVNMKPIMDLRNQYKDKFEKEHGVRLGFMSFFLKAAIEALKRFPAVNGCIDGSDIVYHGYYDIGIAVSSPRGLVVPILRDADHLSFADIEKAIANFGKKAKEGTLSVDDLTGGTFSITNGGVFGSMMSTPILNPPQSAILGMHATKDRAMVENGQVVVRPMMYLALSYDHRIIDGREAVSSLVTIKECLEDPARLLLQV